MPAKRSTRKPRKRHSDRTGMRGDRAGCTRSRASLLRSYQTKTSSVARIGRSRRASTIRPCSLRQLPARPPSASSGVTTAAVSGGFGSRAQIPAPPASMPPIPPDGVALPFATMRRSAAANRPLIIPPARPWKAFQRSPQALLLPRRQAARPARWPSAAA